MERALLVTTSMLSPEEHLNQARKASPETHRHLPFAIRIHFSLIRNGVGVHFNIINIIIIMASDIVLVSNL